MHVGEFRSVFCSVLVIIEENGFGDLSSNS